MKKKKGPVKPDPEALAIAAGNLRTLKQGNSDLGRAGGTARAKVLTSGQRRKIAQTAALVRWGKTA